MDDKDLIISLVLLYVFLNFLIHIAFFVNIIFNHQWQIVNLCRHLCQRCFRTGRRKHPQTGSYTHISNIRPISQSDINVIEFHGDLSSYERAVGERNLHSCSFE